MDIMVCNVYQGAAIGCVTSSLFSLWLAIGTFVVRPHHETLPMSVENCSSLLQNELWTTVSSTVWNETGMVLSSTPCCDSEPNWTTAEMPSTSYMQQL